MSSREQVDPDLLSDNYRSYSSGGFANCVNLSRMAGHHQHIINEIYPLMSETDFENHLRNLEKRLKDGEKFSVSFSFLLQ